MDKQDIKTRDGVCPSYWFSPEKKGLDVARAPNGALRHPAVLMFMDGIAIRPALFEVAERIAAAGYLVLVPDLFYRSGPYEPMDARTVFSDPEQRKLIGLKFAQATPANIMSDTPAFLDALAAHPDAKPGPVGVFGYCMGGLAALTAAGTYPERFAVIASYHGGRLASDAPDSPHLLAPRIKARVYIAGAIEDPSFPDEMKARLDTALRDAGVNYRIETYPAKHGWVFRDTPVYDANASERHFQTLLALLGETLPR